MKNAFIVVCGGEGSGKTSQLEVFKAKVGQEKWVFSREPGGSLFGEAIRELALKHPLAKEATAQTMFGLMWASRSDHLEKLVKPALDVGKNVLCDRFDCCSYAYQIFGQEHASLKELFWKTREIFCGETVPVLYIFFDVEPEVGLARVASRKGLDQDHFDERDLAFHRRIQAGYREFLVSVPHKIIDANRSFDEVANEFERIVNEMFVKE